MITIYTDGASRGNPGISLSGYIIFRNSTLIKKGIIENGIATNNFAEHNAIYNSLKWCSENVENLKKYDIVLYSDSQLAINQLNGAYKIKNIKLKALCSKTMALIDKFKSLKFINVRRSDSNISEVDSMLNEHLDMIESKKD